MKSTIIIFGNPVAKARPRFRRFKTFVSTYDSQKKEKEEFILQAKAQPIVMFSGPIRLNCSFRLHRPKSHYGTGRNSGVLKKSAPEFHIVKPDLDNLIKFVKDCLNGLAWKDDSQVVEYRNMVKEYATASPSTLVYIEKI